MDEKLIEEVYRDLQAEVSKRYVDGAGKTIQHIIDGFNKLVTRIPDIFSSDKPFETHLGDRFRLEFVSWVKPTDKTVLNKKVTSYNKYYNGELWPYHARIKNLGYNARLYMRVVKIGDEEKASEPFELMQLPVMLRSNLCYLSDHSREPGKENEPHPSLAYEQENDLGGYFIIPKREMIILLQDHSIYNRDLVIRKGKDKNLFSNLMTVRHFSTTRHISITIEPLKSKEPRLIVNYHSVRAVNTGQRGINLGDAFVLLGIKIEDVPKIFNMMRIGDDISNNEIFVVIQDALKTANKNIDKCKDALRKIDREAYNLPEEKGKIVAYENFISDLFPQIKSNHYKACMLAYMTIRVVRVYLGKDEVDDQNRTSNKQFQTPANVLEKLVQQLWRKIRQNIVEEMSSPSITTAAAVANVIKSKTNITNHIHDSFNTGRWGPENDPKTGVVEETARELGLVPIINRITRIVVPGGRKTSNADVEGRMVDPEQTGLVCYVTTPDSDQIGSTRNLSWASRISMEVDGNSIASSILTQIKHLLNPLRQIKTKDAGLVFINANPVGWGNLEEIFNEVRELRRYGKIKHLENGVLKPYFELSLGIKNSCLWMNTSSGRAYVPYIIIYNETTNIGGYEVKKQYTRPITTKNWEELLSTGVVEYIDAFELRHVVIADSYNTYLKNEDVAEERALLLRRLLEEGETEKAKLLYEDIKREEKNNFKTHLAIDPTFLYALSAVIAPFANRIAGVRMALQSKMAAQAIPHQAPQHKNFMGQKYRHLVYNTAPLICTTASKRSQQEFGFGEQVIVAFISLQGNQEDSIIWRKGAIDMGKLMVEVYTTEEFSNVDTGAVHKVTMRPFPRPNEKPDTYDYLDDIGVPAVGEVLREGQIIIGVASYEKDASSSYFKLVDEYRAIERAIWDIHTISEDEYEKEKRLFLQRWDLVGQDLDRLGLLEALVEKKDAKFKEIQDAPNQPRWSDSIVVPPKKSFIVDSVVVFDNELNMRTVRVKLHSLRRPRVADKQNPRASQKATIGEIWNDEDMPFFYDGKMVMVPDIIVNSLAPFARQTNSWFLEMMTGLVDAVGGTRTLADAHRPFDIDWLYRRLRAIGYRERSVPLINGRTGEYFGIIDARTGTFTEANVFIGPSYQTALKHQVQDKGQVRGIGKRDIQTGLAVKGRNTPSGVRYGLMEEVSTGTHGAAFTILDRLRDSTATVNKVICNICGDEAVFNLKHYSCRRCNTTDHQNFTQVLVSKATDYMTHITGMGNILFNYKTDVKKDSSFDVEDIDIEDLDEDEEEDEDDDDDYDDEFDDLE